MSIPRRATIIPARGGIIPRRATIIPRRGRRTFVGHLRDNVHCEKRISLQDSNTKG